jgi:hypothetical protein
MALGRVPDVSKEVAVKFFSYGHLFRWPSEQAGLTVLKRRFQTNSPDFASLLICTKNVAEIKAGYRNSTATCYLLDLLSVLDLIAPTESVKLPIVNEC